MKRLVLSTSQRQSLLAALSWVAVSFGVPSAYAQQPGEDEPTPLLSQNCASERLETFSDRPSVAIGREAYRSLFRLNIVGSEAYLTCSIQPDETRPTTRPTTRSRGALRLNFGLPDSTDARSRVAVTAYVDGERWGSVTLAPRDRLTSWQIDVSDARSVSIEAEQLSNESRSTYVHFVRAELQPNTTGDAGRPGSERPAGDRPSPTPSPSERPEPPEPPDDDEDNGNLPVDLDDVLDLCRQLRICR